MKALSLWQPWASLIGIGVKPEETRSWPPPSGIVGQRIAIHAAKKPIEQALREAGCTNMLVLSMATALEAAGFNIESLPLGKVVCTAVVGRPVRVARFVPGDFNGGSVRSPFVITEDGERREANVFGDFSPGRWLWPMLDVERVEPWDVIGRQGVFDVDGPAAVRTASLFGGGA